MTPTVDLGRYNGYIPRTMSDGVYIEVEFRTAGQIANGPRGTLLMARPYGPGATYPSTFAEVWEVVVDPVEVPEVVERIVDLAHRRFVHGAGLLVPDFLVPPLGRETP